MRSTTARRRSGFGQHRVQRRHDRHGEARQQHEDASAGFATENSEFVLQTNVVETAGVQEVGGAHVVFDVAVFDLQRDRRRIVIGLTVIGHRHDAGLEMATRAPECNRYTVVKAIAPTDICNVTGKGHGGQGNRVKRFVTNC